MPAPAPFRPATVLRPLAECVVVVTPRSFGIHDPVLRRELEGSVGEVRYRPGPLAADALAAEVEDADGLLAGLDEISAAVFDRARRLRVVARYGTGLDRVDLAAAARHGVTVTTTPGANANAVAELAIALLLALARPLVRGRERARDGEWPALTGIELAGRTLGLVGLGRIGSLVAEKARGLGMHVVACDPYLARAEGVELVPLEELAARADAISLHAPLNDETRGLVGRELLERVRPGVLLVNTARGALVDEAALVEALDEGVVAGAALDVLGEEPPPGRHPLLARDDVLVTPHIGPHTAEATTEMGRTAYEELVTVLSGGSPRYPA